MAGWGRAREANIDRGRSASIRYLLYDLLYLLYQLAISNAAFLIIIHDLGNTAQPSFAFQHLFSPGRSCIRRHIRKLNRNNRNQLPTLSATRTTTILRYHNRDISPALCYSTTAPSASPQPVQPVQAVPLLFHPSNPVPSSSVRQPKGELQSALHCPDLPGPGHWRPFPQSGPADQPPQSRLLRPSCVPCSSSITGRVKSRGETD